MARIVRHNAMDDEGVLSLSQIGEEARQVVLEARCEAAKIAGEARARVETARQAAEELGYQAGLARGQEEGLARGRAEGSAEVRSAGAAEAAATLELLRSLLAELQAARAKVVEDARREMLQFALEIAAKVVGSVAGADTSAAEANLRKALVRASGATELVAAVHPSQADRLRQAVEGMLETVEPRLVVRVAGDEAVSPGGVKLSWGQGEVDATIETQLANVAEALLGRAGRYETGGADDGSSRKSQMAIHAHGSLSVGFGQCAREAEV
jgi:flagellar biosynthesis/type III secretory pathway protein FliH